MTYFPWLSLLIFLGLPVAGWTASPGGGAASTTDRSLGPPFEKRVRATLGSETASVIFFEVSDFRCDHCRLFHQRVFPRIKQRFVDTGLVRYVAIPTIPPGGTPAPELFGAARYAIEAGRFWSVQGDLFSLPKNVQVADLAPRVGASPEELAAYLRSPQVAMDLTADEAEVAKLGVKGTPTFILRKRQPDGTFLEAVVEGYESWDYFERFLLDLLARAGE